jgi:peptidoglycan hydrolase CwlO-like protein
MHKTRLQIILTILLILIIAQIAWAQATAFTYQGRLTDSTMAAIQGLHAELTDRNKQIESLVQRINRQQTQFEQQQNRITQQQQLIEGLKKLVCAQTPTAAVCK